MRQGSEKWGGRREKKWMVHSALGKSLPNRCNIVFPFPYLHIGSDNGGFIGKSLAPEREDNIYHCNVFTRSRPYNTSSSASDFKADN